MSQLKILRILLFNAAVVIIAAIGACQSDTPATAENTAVTSSSDQGEIDTAVEDLAQMKAVALVKARELDQQIDQFISKIQDLQTGVSGISVAAKQAVSDFPDLEARFDGYIEKGNFFKDEIDKVVQRLSGKDGDSFSDESNQLVDIAGHVDNLNLAFEDLEKAVEKLKKAKGKNVRLFE